MAQSDWDSMLIGAFRRDFVADVRDRTFMWQLANRYSMVFDDYESLVRRPRKIHESKATVARFVCGYMPEKISSMLIDGADRADVLKAMQSVDVHFKKRDAAEAHARHIEKKRYLSARMSDAAIAEFESAFCKPGGRIGPIKRGGGSI